MNQDEAREALAILRNVVARTRDDSALQNWGLIWMTHGLINGAAFCISGVMVRRGVEHVLPHLLLWSSILVLEFGVIAALRRRKAGAITFVERQIWNIWMTFLGAVLLTAGINVLMGLKIFFLLPMIAVLGAVALAMMGALIDRVYYAGTGIFALTSQLMAVFPDCSLYIFGAAWSVLQVSMGLSLHRQKRRLGVTADGRLV